jgi:hypothetical protein
MCSGNRAYLCRVTIGIEKVCNECTPGQTWLNCFVGVALFNDLTLLVPVIL